MKTIIGNSLFGATVLTISHHGYVLIVAGKQTPTESKFKFKVEAARISAMLLSLLQLKRFSNRKSEPNEE